MYEEFYGFVQSPFSLAPDPRFLYLSETHQEAITLIKHSLRRKEGFIVLTGDIGTGKTTLCRALLEGLDTTTFTSLILNPFTTVEELLREVLLDFGVVSREGLRSGKLASATKHDLVTALHEFLLSLVPLHGSGVLIIDEAQHLSPDVLEQIRVLSNLETNDAKLLQIVLVGQLNLLDVLAMAEMRQLDQRISLKATLAPLSRTELEAYIDHRLAIAGGRSLVSFLPEAIDRVQAYSGGVPRVVNLLCDRALAVGADAVTTDITPAVVDQAAAALDLKAPGGQGWLRWLTPGRRRTLIAVAIAVLALVLVAMLVPAERLVPVTPLDPPSSPPPRLPDPVTRPDASPAL